MIIIHVEVLERLIDVQYQDGWRIIWCRDFNSNNSLWDWGYININGKMIEVHLEERVGMSE